MSEIAIEETEAAPEPVRRPRWRRWLSALAKFVTGFLLGLTALFAAMLALLDTGPGHRLIVDRIAAMTPASGLRVRIGRIDGSIWSETRLRDVRLYDPDGLFAESPEIEMDWRPIDFFWNSLRIHRLESNLVILHRLPQLVPSREPRPILPSYDVHVGRLDVRQLRIGRAVTGRERSGSLHGEAEIRSGRALMALDSPLRAGGGGILVRLEAEPDGNRFDLDARIDAPANSVLGAMLGTARPVRLVLDGDGTWGRWLGSAQLDVSGRRTSEIQLRMETGRFSLRGWAAPAPFLTGKLQRLTAPRVLVGGSGRFADRRFDGRLSLLSPALRLEARGLVDLRRGRYENVQVAAQLLRPPALFTNMTGRQVRVAAMLDGAFGSARFVYRLTSPHIAFDETGFDDIRLEGRGSLSRPPVRVPILATARRVTGVGEVAGGILANLRVQGILDVTASRLSGDNLMLSSAKLRGLLSLSVDLRSGVYAVTMVGGMRTYVIPGFGVVDVLSELRAVPGPGGRGTLVTGTARAWVRRLDNRFLGWVAGGLPRLETQLTRGPDRIIRFTNLRLVAPNLTLTGSGIRRIDGTFQFEGAGRHADYGPLRLGLDGRIERPRLAIRLERPVDSLGLANVLLNLEPNPSGFAWRAEGGSTLGPFNGAGSILLPPGQPAIVQVAALNVSGTHASGALRSDADGFTGRLAVAGGGLEGTLLFNPVGGNQRIAVDLTANDAAFVGPPPVVIRRGTIRGVVLLDPGGTSVEGRIVARGVSRGPLSIASLDAQASLRGGTGQARIRIAGSRGRDFSFDALADIAPGRFRVSGSGTLDRRPLELVTPAMLTASEEGWRLAPTQFRFAGGSASLAGLFGLRTEIDAQLQAMPLSVLDIAWPDLGLGGIASGSVRYRSASPDAPPSGAADLRVRGLTRSGPAAIAANMGGTLAVPVINGSVRTTGARLESAVTGMVIDNLAMSGQFGGSQLRITSFSGRTAGGGAVSGSGALDFAVVQGVGMNFDVRAENARLLDRDDIQAAVTGDLAIRSDGAGGSIGGDVRVTSGRFRLGSATSTAQIARLNVREVGGAAADLAPTVRHVAPWRLALGVVAPNRMNVTGLGMNSEWRAELQVAGTGTEPRITGDATLLHGTYDFAGRRFDLIRGNIRFQGESPVNPQLDIAAEARVRGLSAQIRVTGRSQRPEIAFTSTPALPQDELLSRILFGTSITNLSAPEAVQLASAVASLNDPRGGLDPINALRRGIGLDRLRILPADVTQGIGTQVAAGKYLGRRVYVEVITDGRGYSATTVEYQITRWLSILSSISTIGRESVNVRVSRDY